MTDDMRQLISKVLFVSMTVALALSLAACDQPRSGDSIGRSFDKSVDNVRQDLNQVPSDAARTVGNAHDKAGEKSTEAGPAANNIALAARVKAALVGTRALSSSNIDVDATTNGVVTLTGIAEDATKRDLAERLTLSVEGVTAVRNGITIARGS